MRCSCGGALLLDLRGCFFVVTREECSQVKHDVDFVCSIGDSEGGLCDLDLNEALRGREATTHTCDLYTLGSEYTAYSLNKVGVHTDRSDRRNVLCALEVIDASYELCHFLLGVCARECS